MRLWLLGFVSGGLFVVALPMFAEDVFRISPGGSAPLTDRVGALERAVAQLQDQVYGTAVPSKPKTSSGGYGVTCALETPFDGAFSANAPTEEVAREETLKRCREKAKNSIYCSRREVKCRR
mgnify:CR=1 FL=1